MKNSTEFTSNSLAIMSKILTLLENLDISIHRKLLDVGSDSDEFLEWMHPGDRRLVQETLLWIRLVIHTLLLKNQNQQIERTKSFNRSNKEHQLF
uniref:Uncharacterized protein n=1 Tax=Nelumbo nucifera TaxID=4432 RepID=A0A822Y701_NELNU|nr:TPA_asm: hypothetical protein HUJ06_028273 [Nelumbo nucifera]